MDDGVDSGEGPDDSPWRPGADVRFDHPPIRPFAALPAEPSRPAGGRVGPASTAPDQTTSTPRAVPSRQRAALGAVLVLALAVIGVVVVVGGGTGVPAGEIEQRATADGDESAGDDSATVRPVVIGDLGGDVTLGRGDVPLLASSQCAVQRLPAAVDPRWTVELPDARQIVSPVSVGDDSVIAVLGLDDGSANGLGSVAVVALDVNDGEERWRTDVQPATGRHDVLGVVDRAVIVRSFAGPDMAYRRLLAFDEGSGALLWDQGFDGDWSASVNPTTGLVVVEVRRPGASVIEESAVELIGPRSGERVDVVEGAFVGFAPDGRVVTRIGDKVLATAGESSDLLGLVEPGGAPFTVLGSEVVVADDEAGALLVFDGGAEPRQLPIVGSAGIDAPSGIVLLAPLGGTSLVVHGDGYVYGAHIGDQTVELRWRVRGVVSGSAATDRGRALLVATEGGAQQRVIDGSTGRTIVDVVLRPGSLETLTLAANGVAVQEFIDGEPVRRTLDLDGRELWSLPGSGGFAVGSGVIVDDDDSETPARIAAWGEPPSASPGATGCRSVMTEWIPR